ncbi:MAG: virulence protein [Ruminococcus sp.]|nr:virulence protein [Ruminococcus sp.]
MSTFTANYNVTGSDRKELVNLVAETIGSPAKYQGAPSFAYTVDYITIDRNGVLSFDSRADTGVIENLLEQLAEHGFTAELPETAPDSPDTAENSEVEEVPGDEEITEHDETVGLTIYLPKDKANIDLLRQLVQGKSGLIKKALGLKNLPIEEDSDEIVFPWFADASGLSPDEVKAYTAFISALCKLSANAKRVSMTEKPVDNEKYAFRCFLLRLGFIGREHKITRKILLRNLEGSSAFKNGGADDETSE